MDTDRFNLHSESKRRKRRITVFYHPFFYQKFTWVLVNHPAIKIWGSAYKTKLFYVSQSPINKRIRLFLAFYDGYNRNFMRDSLRRILSRHHTVSAGIWPRPESSGEIKVAPVLEPTWAVIKKCRNSHLTNPMREYFCLNPKSNWEFISFFV